MTYSYCLEGDKIVSICPDDLSGCSDWHRGEIGLTPEDNLWDEHGAALYRLENELAVERSIEERMADWPAEPEIEATAEDYRAALADLGVEV